MPPRATDHARVTEGLESCVEGLDETPQLHALREWQAAPAPTEHPLSTAILTLATGALQNDNSLEVRGRCLVGLEGCLSLAAGSLMEESYLRLKAPVLERTLPHLDAIGQTLAQKASSELLCPGFEPARIVGAFLAIVTLLFRCVGVERMGGQDMLELVNGDLALAVATLVEGLREQPPSGIPGWSEGLARLLLKLASPDAFMWLLRRADPQKDFNDVPMQQTWQLQRSHAHVLAQALVQFDGFSAMLSAAEAPTQRAAVLDSMLRLILTLAGSRGYARSGRLLSRWATLEFTKFGYRFLAPMTRKFIDDWRNPQAERSIRRISQVFSWLIVHAEADDSRLLAESLRPLATEWASRAHSFGAPAPMLAALLALAANAGSSNPQALEMLRPVVERLHSLGHMDGASLHRWMALTPSAAEALRAVGFQVPFVDDSMWEPEADMDATVPDVSEGVLPTEDDSVAGGGAECSDCGLVSQAGGYGEGYFAGAWFCERCWNVWHEAESTRAPLSMFPLEGGEGTGTAQTPQSGAAALLLLAPRELRCGVSGSLMTGAKSAGGMPVRIPSSVTASFPVAYLRRPLEQWHRRSGGRCPLSGELLDMQAAVEAPDVLEDLRSWLGSTMCASAYR